MELISTAKSTQLVSFDKLETKFIYHHVANEPRDLHCFSKNKIFLEVNKKSGFEMLCVKNTDANVNEIKLLRKMKVDNLYCIACPNQTTDYIALGLSSGQVGLLNYRNSKYLTKFRGESSCNGVVFLDFNASDEYLSAVYENGLINLYGLKTKTKLETLTFDKNSTLARFNPTKRFHLSIASYTGSVYIYDMQSKRKTFGADDAHCAPCRDICTSPATPDILLSAGYDCIMNIFDTRRKLTAQQIRSNHPLSSICISECGRFSCVGNLKGELISYDLRNLKSFLDTNLVHDGAVVRVAFVPQEEGANLSGLEMSGNVLTETQNLPVDDKTANPRRDSFFDFINGCSFDGRNTLLRRDSFNLERYECKRSDDPRISTDGHSSARSSMDARVSMDLKSINSILPDVSNIEVQCASNKIKGRRSSFENILCDRESKSKVIDLIEEEEEEELLDDVFGKICDKTENDSVDCSKNRDKKSTNFTENHEMSKENNALNISKKDINYLKKLPDDKNSTPNAPKKNSSNIKGEPKQESEMNSAEMGMVLSEIKNLRNEMNEKLKMLESEIKFQAEGNKSDMYMHNFNLWKHQMNLGEDIRAMMAGLLRSDTFVMEFLQLQEENETLKATIKNLRNIR